MTDEVPQGTIATVLEWVGDDRDRAWDALQAEFAGAQRSTLIPRLQAIASKEAAEVTSPSSTPDEQPASESQDTGSQLDTEQPAAQDQEVADSGSGDVREDQSEEAAEELGLAPAPEQPLDAVVDARGPSTVFHGIALRDADVEAPEDGGLRPAPPQRDEAEDDSEPIDGEQVELIDAASDGNGLALVINGTVYLFNKQMVGSLKHAVDRTVVGLAL